MTVALDVGTSSLVIAIGRGGGPVLTREANAIALLPADSFTREMLASAHTDYVEHTDDGYWGAGSRLLVAGNDALRFAATYDARYRRPMSHGVLDPEEAHSESWMRLLIDRLLPIAEPGGEVCVVTVPAQSADHAIDATYHRALMVRTVEGYGYRVETVPAVVALDALVRLQHPPSRVATDCSFTFGAGVTSVSLRNDATLVRACSLGPGGDSIDARIARHVGSSYAPLRSGYTSSSFDLSQSYASGIPLALQAYYDDLLKQVAQDFATVLRESLSDVRSLLRVFVAGGVATPKGFAERFEHALAEFVPISLSEVCVLDNPLDATALGALEIARSLTSGDAGHFEVPLPPRPQTSPLGSAAVPDTGSDDDEIGLLHATFTDRAVGGVPQSSGSAAQVAGASATGSAAPAPAPPSRPHVPARAPAPQAHEGEWDDDLQANYVDVEMEADGQTQVSVGDFDPYVHLQGVARALGLGLHDYIYRVQAATANSAPVGTQAQSEATDSATSRHTHLSTQPEQVGSRHVLAVSDRYPTPENEHDREVLVDAFQQRYGTTASSRDASVKANDRESIASDTQGAADKGEHPVPSARGTSGKAATKKGAAKKGTKPRAKTAKRSTRRGKKS